MRETKETTENVASDEKTDKMTETTTTVKKMMKEATVNTMIKLMKEILLQDHPEDNITKDIIPASRQSTETTNTQEDRDTAKIGKTNTH